MMKKIMKTGYAVKPDPGAVGPSNKTIRPPEDGPNTPWRAWRHGGGCASFFVKRSKKSGQQK